MIQILGRKVALFFTLESELYKQALISPYNYDENSVNSIYKSSALSSYTFGMNYKKDTGI